MPHAPLPTVDGPSGHDHRRWQFARSGHLRAMA
jgi:hypothetical protein